MRIQVYVQDDELPPLFETFAEEKITEILGHLAERLTSVEVHVKDMNSHKKSGVDKRCTIEARPRGLDPIAVESDAQQARDALTQAGAKLERALRNRFEKLADY